jgi:hypothetical protein
MRYGELEDLTLIIVKDICPEPEAVELHSSKDEEGFRINAKATRAALGAVPVLSLLDDSTRVRMA